MKTAEEGAEEYVSKIGFNNPQTDEFDSAELIAAYLAGYHADRWVKCSERMPEKKDRYLILIPGTPWAVTANYEDEGKWVSPMCDYGCELREEHPTHWQPLPEKPGEG